MSVMRDTGEMRLLLALAAACVDPELTRAVLGTRLVHHVLWAVSLTKELQLRARKNAIVLQELWLWAM